MQTPSQPREIPPGSSQELRAPPGSLILLRDLIHERTGVFFEESRADILVEKMQSFAQARECSSVLDLYYLLKDGGQEEWNGVADALSVQETYFWREMSQIKV